MARLLKSERLKSRDRIQEIFSGNSERVGKYPLLLFYTKSDEASASSFQVLFSVSKRNFPRAVDRNTMKRRMREAFRANKTALNDLLPLNNQLALAVIYTGKELSSVDSLSNTFSKLYEILAQRLSEIN
ncbi:MAG: ribonuclease P protein component [Bacteroidia bacterium]|nr:ribonuclease P protein component [Bacteroidia bacterium]